MILRKEIIEQISKSLSLPFTGVEQDWDIEMANASRIDEFINFYKKNNLSNDMKFAAMCLILTSYDDFLNNHDLNRDDKWDVIEVELNSQRQIFDSLIGYWSLEGKTKNIFRITPLLREIK